MPEYRVHRAPHPIAISRPSRKLRRRAVAATSRAGPQLAALFAYLVLGN